MKNPNQSKAVTLANYKRHGHKFFGFTIKNGKTKFTYRGEKKKFKSIQEAFDFIRGVINQETK